jgi:hypothetical protein
MTKFEICVLVVLACVLTMFGWDDGGWIHRLCLLMGGIIYGVVMVFALDERVGGEDE